MPSNLKIRLSHTFRSLRQRNYLIWAIGALVSNIGTWMQRIAQDWLVLTNLTNHSGATVGIVMALQFGPPILLIPWSGWVADHFDRRKVLLLTQSAMGLTALGLGLLVTSGAVRLWHVYLFAALTGCATAFDSPVRQTFVAELVGDDDLPNAVALNATLFHGARLVGPAVAGVLINVIGTGWVFIINALSFVAVIFALMNLRLGDLHPARKGRAAADGINNGLSYVRHRPDLMIALLMLFIVGTYGLNFPIFISTMSVSSFGGGAHLYGSLSSAMAIGSVSGALLVAGRRKPGIQVLTLSALAFGLIGTLAAVMPNVLTFGLILVVLGITAQIFTTSTNSLVQLSTAPEMRGRVMAIYMGVFLGCTPLGAPLIGWIADHFGPRPAMMVGAASGFVAAVVGMVFLHVRKQSKKPGAARISDH